MCCRCSFYRNFGALDSLPPGAQGQFVASASSGAPLVTNNTFTFVTQKLPPAGVTQILRTSTVTLSALGSEVPDATEGQVLSLL